MHLNELDITDGNVLSAWDLESIVNPIVTLLNGGLATINYDDYSVTRDKLALLSVGTAQIANEAVTTAKITPRNITTALLDNTPSSEAVTEDVVRDSTVSSGKIKTSGTDGLQFLPIIEVGNYDGNGGSKSITSLFGGLSVTPRCVIIFWSDANNNNTRAGCISLVDSAGTVWTKHFTRDSTAGPSKILDDQVTFGLGQFSVAVSVTDGAASFDITRSGEQYSFIAIANITDNTITDYT